MLLDSGELARFLIAELPIKTWCQGMLDPSFLIDCASVCRSLIERPDTIMSSGSVAAESGEELAVASSSFFSNFLFVFMAHINGNSFSSGHVASHGTRTSTLVEVRLRE
jgi:hypothetical protein